MDKKKKIGVIVGGLIIGTTVAAKIAENKSRQHIYKVEDSSVTDKMSKLPNRKMSFYEKHIKRGLDVACSATAITLFSPLYLSLAILVKRKLGSPVLFTQERPGMTSDGKETIFKMYKFRSMTDERDENGNLLPDDDRMTKFGSWLRSTSLDELPEAFNIFNGTMSVIGPRPQLVRDMVFMSDEERMRHTAKPGLSGLAQVNGRNAIKWEDRLYWDEQYIRKVTFLEDLKIVFETVKTAFFKHEGITEENMSTSTDLGDYLLETGKVDQKEYDAKQEMAKEILSEI